LTTPPPLLQLNPKEFESTLWFKRHWKWVVPLGVLVVGSFALAFALGLVHVMKQSDAYQIPLGRARSAAAVIEQVGEPMREGWFLQGNIQLVNDGGTANISFPLKGPKGECTVFVVAWKKAGNWHYRRVVVVPDSGRQIDLSDPGYRSDTQPDI
jgi:Cytochrome oxidase complex assembly protein 1